MNFHGFRKALKVERWLKKNRRSSKKKFLINQISSPLNILRRWGGWRSKIGQKVLLII